MTLEESRPDPDALLRRIQQDEARAKRGKLRIFFGFAPGVGKTYRMLQVAQDLAANQGVEVVVGVVEDHRRPETARLAEGLEALPRAFVPYRGRKLEEFDLDAALLRRPKVLLVDELAHTNAPGCRHPKRWQDVEELLDAGIDVFTTVNVQHIESLNDVIAQITGIRVRETLPDLVLERADAIELVDIAPEELLARLKEGKVYLPEQARRAADHFFQRGNLLALRELALRRTAQFVDDEFLELREAAGVKATWPAGERVLVCVGPAPSSGRLIRAAARMAAGLRCPWTAAFVESSTQRPLNEASSTQLEAHLRLAEALGATLVRLEGPSVAVALLDHARLHNITRLIVGKPTHARIWDRLRGSLVDALVRGSGDIDVHVITGDAEGSPPPRAIPEPRGPIVWWHYSATAALVACTLGVALLLREWMALPDLGMVFLLTVMVAATWFGRGPSILAAALGTALYDFFFVPPFYTFTVEDSRYFITFLMMFAVGLAMSELAGKLRRQQRNAQDREKQTSALYALTRDMASADDLGQIARVAAKHAGTVFSARVAVLSPDASGQLHSTGADSAALELDAKALGVAKWSYEHGAMAGRGTDTLHGADCVCVPLIARQSRLGVLALWPHAKGGFSADQRTLLDMFCRQVSAAFERARLSEDASGARLKAKTEEMRASLLSAVSHDLRTPLASITAAATSLRDDSNLPSEVRQDLTQAIVEEAERLERLVANLLEITRLESGALVLRRDWVPIEEIVGSALTRLESQMGARPVSISIPPGTPMVWVDPVLLEQIFVNLLENANKYTPAYARVSIEVQPREEGLQIQVIDEGPGLPTGSEQLIFDKFYRGSHAGQLGAGLGLAICKGIVEAHGGSIQAQSRPAQGAVFSIWLPFGGTPPTVALPGGGP